MSSRGDVLMKIDEMTKSADSHGAKGGAHGAPATKRRARPDVSKRNQLLLLRQNRFFVNIPIL